MKAAKKIILSLFLIIIGSIFFACKEAGSPPKNAISKPPLNAAMANSETIENRGSEFQAKFNITFYGKKTQTQNTFNIGQNIKLKRIQNDGQIYIDGEIGSVDVSDEILLPINLIFNTLNKDDTDQNKESDFNFANLFTDYLNGKFKIKFKVGYDGEGNYNFKVNFKYNENVIEKWVGINQDVFKSVLKSIKYGKEVNLCEYLMLSTYIDPANSKWIDEDTASMFWNDSLNAYNYEMKLNDKQLIDTFFKTVDTVVQAFDKNEYQKPIEKYNKYISYFKKWISVGDNGMAATVNEDGLLNDLTTCATLFANIDLNEANTLLVDILNEKTFSKVQSILEQVSLLFKGINGENGKIGIGLQLILDEQFAYDSDNLSLKDVDSELFSDCNKQIPNRYTADFSVFEQIWTDNKGNTLLKELFKKVYSEFYTAKKEA